MLSVQVQKYVPLHHALIWMSIVALLQHRYVVVEDVLHFDTFRAPRLCYEIVTRIACLEVVPILSLLHVTHSKVCGPIAEVTMLQGLMLKSCWRAMVAGQRPE